MTWLLPIRMQLSPPLDALRSFAQQARSVELSAHPHGRIESGDLPKGWYVSNVRRVVGHGAAAYEDGRAALRRLDCMQLPWLKASVDDSVLAICSRQLWCARAPRFVSLQCSRHAQYLPDGRHPNGRGHVLQFTRRFEEPVSCGACRVCFVSWGTSRMHVLAGEEKLQLEWDQSTDEVIFSILSFSRPRHPLSVMTYPFVLALPWRSSVDYSADSSMHSTTDHSHRLDCPSGHPVDCRNVCHTAAYGCTALFDRGHFLAETELCGVRRVFWRLVILSYGLSPMVARASPCRGYVNARADAGSDSANDVPTRFVQTLSVSLLCEQTLSVSLLCASNPDIAAFTCISRASDYCPASRHE
eukprot:6214661-Pleurochrysis_carterae.AAC.4